MRIKDSSSMVAPLMYSEDFAKEMKVKYLIWKLYSVQKRNIDQIFDLRTASFLQTFFFLALSAFILFLLHLKTKIRIQIRDSQPTLLLY